LSRIRLCIEKQKGEEYKAKERKGRLSKSGCVCVSAQAKLAPNRKKKKKTKRTHEKIFFLKAEEYNYVKEIFKKTSKQKTRAKEKHIK